jgi:RNase P/RNase MRP subunit p29
MRANRLLSQIPGLLILLAPLFVVACSVPFISSSSNSASVTPCPSPVPFQRTSGTIQSINGNTLLITSTQGSTIKASYTSTTRFTRETAETTAALKEGVFVFVAVAQGANNTYTATTISLTSGSRPTGGFGGSGFGGRRGNGNSTCARQRFGNGNGTPGAEFGNGNTRGISGTVSQLTSKTLTVTDTNQSDYVVSLTSATQIIQTSQVSASTLQVGMRVNVVGLRNAQGVIAARSVTILLPK